MVRRNPKFAHLFPNQGVFDGVAAKNRTVRKIVSNAAQPVDKSTALLLQRLAKNQRAALREGSAISRAHKVNKRVDRVLRDPVYVEKVLGRLERRQKKE